LLDAWGLGAGEGRGRPISTDPRAKRCALVGPGSRASASAGRPDPGCQGRSRRAGERAVTGGAAAVPGQRAGRRPEDARGSQRPGAAAVGGFSGVGACVPVDQSTLCRGVYVPQPTNPFGVGGSTPAWPNDAKGLALVVALATPDWWMQPKWGPGAFLLPFSPKMAGFGGCTG